MEDLKLDECIVVHGGRENWPMAARDPNAQLKPLEWGTVGALLQVDLHVGDFAGIHPDGALHAEGAEVEDDLVAAGAEILEAMVSQSMEPLRSSYPVTFSIPSPTTSS